MALTFAFEQLFRVGFSLQSFFWWSRYSSIFECSFFFSFRKPNFVISFSISWSKEQHKCLLWIFYKYELVFLGIKMKRKIWDLFIPNSLWRIWSGTGKFSLNIFGITIKPKSWFFFADLASEKPKIASSCAWKFSNKDKKKEIYNH